MGQPTLLTETQSPPQTPKVIDRPYGNPSGNPGKTEGYSSTFIHIMLFLSRPHLQQVWSCSNGHLLLEATCTVSPAHQHKGIISVRLQLRNQLPFQVAEHLNALLVVQDLKARHGHV